MAIVKLQRFSAASFLRECCTRGIATSSPYTSLLIVTAKVIARLLVLLYTLNVFCKDAAEVLRLRDSCRRCRENRRRLVRDRQVSGDIEASEQLLSPGVTVAPAQ